MEDDRLNGKRIFFLRHGQSLWNAATEERGELDPLLWDAALTPRGERQANAARAAINAAVADCNLAGDCVIVTSPLTRAMLTCERACRDLVSKGVPVLVQPLARERTSGADDFGSTSDALAARFPLFDLSLLGGRRCWWYTGTNPPGTLCGSSGFNAVFDWGPGFDDEPAMGRARYEEGLFKAEPDEVFRPRLNAWRAWLLERKERVIVVVTHQDMTAALVPGLSLRNCELAECWVDSTGAFREVNRWAAHLDGAEVEAKNEKEAIVI
jgi:broad specificity phosphatase PhoE